MPLMRSGKLTAPSWCCAAPESAMSWVSVSLVPLRVVISASIRLKSGHVRPVTTATPLRPLDQRGSFEADGSPCVSALLHAHDIALVPDEVQSELAEKAGFRTLLKNAPEAAAADRDATEGWERGFESLRPLQVSSRKTSG